MGAPLCLEFLAIFEPTNHRDRIMRRCHRKTSLARYRAVFTLI